VQTIKTYIFTLYELLLKPSKISFIFEFFYFPFLAKLLQYKTNAELIPFQGTFQGTWGHTVNQHLPLDVHHHPLDARYESVLDEPQLSYYLVSSW
jgi:hypothetical protein